MNTRTNRIQVLVNQKELTKLKNLANNGSLSSYLRKSGLREKQQISNPNHEIKVKAYKAEVKYYLEQAKIAINSGYLPDISTINKLIEITDNL